MRICEEHFAPNSYRMAIMRPVSRKLRDDAVPSLKLPKDAPSKRRATFVAHSSLTTEQLKPLAVRLSTSTQTDTTVKALQERGCQTEPWEQPVQRNVMVSPKHTTAPIPVPSLIQTEDEDTSDSYSPSQEESSSDEHDAFPPCTPQQERKFLVFESCLLELFRTCPQCFSTCSNKITTQGTMISVKSQCRHGHVRSWDSQPMNERVTASVQMEKDGLIRSLRFLKEHGITLKSVTTDRHPAIRKHMETHEQETKRFFDIWHISKSVKEKLTAISKSASCRSLDGWIQGTSNHLYWCAKAGGGNFQMTVDAWLSIHNHVINIHNGHAGSYLRYLHGPIPNGDWLEPDSLAYKKFKEVTGNTRILKDVAQMSPNIQTYALESFHSLLIRFAPKLVAFSLEGNLCTTRLAVLHYNENAEHCQAETSAGVQRWKVKSCKARQGHQVACPIKTPPTFNYIVKLLAQAETMQFVHII
ncbi:uncharacterized protein LOC135400419 [Ornithodoros turicata]|uniref:uncharacterized protein LOC135400419 n=1 Tax=Ornithodoros turicata TaxID=34597 RepID=UPI003139D5BD